jgi:hypothetical protein
MHGIKLRVTHGSSNPATGRRQKLRYLRYLLFKRGLSRRDQMPGAKKETTSGLADDEIKQAVP